MITPITNLFRTRAEALVLEKGSEEVGERLAAGVLPQEDFEHAVREILFAPIASYPRWRKIKADHVRELAVLRGAVEAGAYAPVEFETIEADEFSAGEWKRLKELREALPDATVKALWVVAICGKHEEFTTKYPKARVVLDFYGRHFLKEISLRD